MARKLFYIRAVLLLVIPGCGGLKAARSPSLTLELMTPAHTAYLDAYAEGLARLAGKSATADTLYAFYRSHAIPAQLVGGQAFVPVRLATGQDFYVAPAITDTVDTEAPTFVVAGYSYDLDLLVLRSIDLTPLLRGLYLAHELVHAYRDKVRQVPQYALLSEAWVREEIIAHVAESRFLNEYTNGAWDRVVQDGVNRWLRLIERQDLVPDEVFELVAREDERALSGLFPRLPVVDFDLIFMMYRHTLTIRRYSHTAATLEDAQRSILRYFMAYYAQRLKP